MTGMRRRRVLPENFCQEKQPFQRLRPTWSQELVDMDKFGRTLAFTRKRSCVVDIVQTPKPDCRTGPAIGAASRPPAAQEVLFKLPKETVAMLDAIKERQGLRNRSQALLQLIEQGRAAAQQTT